MNKQKLQQNIEKMEAELQQMKLELEKCDKVKLEGGKYYINGYGHVEKYDATPVDIKNGATRATRELAEIASKNMVARNKLEAYAMQLEPEWRDVIGIPAYYIYKNKNIFMVGSFCEHRHIGCVYMSKQAAETLCEWLNDGRITLEKE